MPTESQQRMAEFYQAVVNRAPHACRTWAAAEPTLPIEDGFTLVPGGQWVAPEWIALWPMLHVGPGDQPEPAFVLDRYAVEQAFTRLLKRNSDIPYDQISAWSRHQLGLIEQDADAAALNDRHIEAIVQIAVFGWVAIG